jgi:hypothetical protein
MGNKNVNAINKIIAELSARDYHAQAEKLTKAQKQKRLFGKYQFSYSLSEETKEAIEIKNDYLSGKITEPEYKRFCLEYNLRTVELVKES